MDRADFFPQNQWISCVPESSNHHEEGEYLVAGYNGVHRVSVTLNPPSITVEFETDKFKIY
jgi:hypothetical protein